VGRQAAIFPLTWDLGETVLVSPLATTPPVTPSMASVSPLRENSITILVVSQWYLTSLMRCVDIDREQ